jgi:hypothetical protein
MNRTYRENAEALGGSAVSRIPKNGRAAPPPFPYFIQDECVTCRAIIYDPGGQLLILGHLGAALMWLCHP